MASATSAPATADSQAGSKKEEIQNEYIQLVYKKIRALNKKMQKIKEIEEKQQGGSVLNEEQKKTLGNKKNTEKQLDDYNNLRIQYTKIHTQEEKLRSKQKKKESEKFFERTAEQLAAVVKLMSFASYLENPDSRKKHLVEQEEAVRSGKKSFLASESELNAVSLLASSILKRGLEKATVDQAVESASKYVNKIEKDIVPGVSYKRVCEQITDYFMSKWAPVEPPKPVEVPVQKQEEVPAVPSAASAAPAEVTPSSAPVGSNAASTSAPASGSPAIESPSQHVDQSEEASFEDQTEGSGEGSQDGFTTQGRDREGRRGGRRGFRGRGYRGENWERRGGRGGRGRGRGSGNRDRDRDRGAHQGGNHVQTQ